MNLYSCGSCGDIFTADQGATFKDSPVHQSFTCTTCQLTKEMN